MKKIKILGALVIIIIVLFLIVAFSVRILNISLFNKPITPSSTSISILPAKTTGDLSKLTKNAEKVIGLFKEDGSGVVNYDTPMTDFLKILDKLDVAYDYQSDGSSAGIVYWGKGEYSYNFSHYGVTVK